MLLDAEFKAHRKEGAARSTQKRNKRFFTSSSRLDVDVNNNRSKCKHRPGVNVIRPVLLPEVSTEHTWEQLGAVTWVTSAEFKGTWKAASTSLPVLRVTTWHRDQNKTAFWSETKQRRDKCMKAADDSRTFPLKKKKLGILMMQHSQWAFTCRKKFPYFTLIITKW